MGDIIKDHNIIDVINSLGESSKLSDEIANITRNLKLTFRDLLHSFGSWN